jgi:hypothetical protein
MTNYSVRLGSTNAIKVRSTSLVASDTNSLAGLSDIDITTNGLADGMVLVYNAASGKWQSTSEITAGASRNMTINGGVF